MAEAKIDVRINASDLEALRALAERMERAAQQTEVLTSLRLPLPPGACRACEAKDRDFQQECAAHNVTRESLKATTRKEARLEQECDALKKVNDNALAELRCQRVVFERESAEHFATRIALRDTLRAAAERAREVADYAEEASETAYGKDVREIAATYDETRAALGLDETAAPDAGETAKPARTPFRAGDIVNHRRSGENWVLACDEFDGYVMPAGWPDSVEPANGCDIVKPATDEERVAILKQAADSTGTRAARAKQQLEASAHEQPAPEPARRRRFRAGDSVRLPAQTTVYSAVLDENDAGSVAIEVSRNELNCISTSALTLIEPTHRARRNRELAFHFHRWSISTDADAMDSVPEFVRVAAEQLLRDPFGTEYGSVLADAKTGGAK